MMILITHSAPAATVSEGATAGDEHSKEPCCIHVSYMLII